MKEFEFLKKTQEVKAPEDFEQNVMTLISRREKKMKKVRFVRLSLAWTASALGVILLVFNLFFLNRSQTGPVIANEQYPSIQQQEDYFKPGFENRIPITEAVDYSREIIEKSQKSRTIYILEQVSESTEANNKY